MPNIDELIAIEVDRQLRRRLSAMQVAILTQQEGTPVTGGHRTLNFTGPGVGVIDDPTARRTNIFIPGGGVSTSVSTFVSNTAAKLHNVSPITDNPDTDFPGWKLAGFNDSAWANAVVAYNVGTGARPPTGSSSIWDTATRPNSDPAQKLVLRKEYTIPSGTIASATLDAAFDGLGSIYINGTLIGTAGTLGGTNSDLSGSVTGVTVSPSLLVPGSTICIAVVVQGSTYTIAHNRWTAWTLTVNSGGVGGFPYVNVQDQKAQNTAGGTFTSGAWQTRTLNTLAFDTTNIASLASNQITLPAGTYRVLIKVPAYAVDRHQARLQNITDGTTLLTGTTETALAAGNNVTSSVITGRFTLGGPKALAVQHQCQTTGANGFGVAANFTTEIYTVAEFWKEG